MLNQRSARVGNTDAGGMPIVANERIEMVLAFVPKNGSGFPQGEKFCIDLDTQTVFALCPDGRKVMLADRGWQNWQFALKFAIEAVEDTGENGWTLEK
jgi:hypothetical protein